MTVSVIAYIHSKICDSIINTANDLGLLSIDGCIYGRGYQGYSGNSLYLLDDVLLDELSLISFGHIISKYFDRQSGDIHLYIPHVKNSLFKLIASHSKVKKVYYIEEGDLNYDESMCNFNLLEIDEVHDSTISPGAAEIVEKLGFNIKNYLYGFNQNFWFDCVLGKYSGVLCVGEKSFKNFPGKRLHVELGNLAIFSEVTSIVLLTNVIYPSVDLMKFFNARGGVLDRDTAMRLLLDGMICYLNNLYSVFSSCGKVFIKAHPALSHAEYRYIVSSVNSEYIIWEDSDYGYFSRKNEISRLNFSNIYSFGATSAARYVCDSNVKINIFDLNDFYELIYLSSIKNNEFEIEEVKI